MKLRGPDLLVPVMKRPTPAPPFPAPLRGPDAFLVLTHAPIMRSREVDVVLVSSLLS